MHPLSRERPWRLSSPRGDTARLHQGQRNRQGQGVVGSPLGTVPAPRVTFRKGRVPPTEAHPPPHPSGSCGGGGHCTPGAVGAPAWGRSRKGCLWDPGPAYESPDALSLDPGSENMMAGGPFRWILISRSQVLRGAPPSARTGGPLLPRRGHLQPQQRAGGAARDMKPGGRASPRWGLRMGRHKSARQTRGGVQEGVQKEAEGTAARGRGRAEGREVLGSDAPCSSEHHAGVGMREAGNWCQQIPPGAERGVEGGVRGGFQGPL